MNSIKRYRKAFLYSFLVITMLCLYCLMPAQHSQLPGDRTSTALEIQQIPGEGNNDLYPIVITEQLAILQQNAKNKSALIAICDTGIDMLHEDLAGSVIASANFSSSDSTVDVNSHGTHIAGIIAASDDNDIGIKGIAPDSQLLNVKITDRNGLVSASAISDGIIWAVDHGAQVINLSFTIDEPVKSIRKAVKYAWEQGAIVVAAVDNYRNAAHSYPAEYDNCIAVTSADNIPGYSHEFFADVAAPGCNIYSTLPGNHYGYKSGTSMATAYVSAIAGLLFSGLHDINGNGRINDEVLYEIQNRCTALGINGIKSNETG